MQGPIYKDMVFASILARAKNCLFLERWTQQVRQAHLPVGLDVAAAGFNAGSASGAAAGWRESGKEGRGCRDFNYGLGIFGFFSILAHEGISAAKASGN